MAQRRLLTKGGAFKRTDNRWGGVVWYMDEAGERKEKPLSLPEQYALGGISYYSESTKCTTLLFQSDRVSPRCGR